jgi:hypothetical protein
MHVSLEARRARLERHAADDLRLQMRSPVSVYQTEPIVCMVESQALLASPQQR